MAFAYEVNLVNLIQDFGSEDKCRAYLEELRWPNGVTCPRCAHKTVSRIQKRGQFDCDGCRYQFTATSGTIMHDTHLPLWKWFLGVYMMVESKKGVSANQLKRSLKVSYKTAWYLCHRVRTALQTPSALMRGVVEVDETYIGGKIRGKARRYTVNKTIALGAIERGGDLRVQTAERVDRKTLREFIRQHVCENAEAICIDESPACGDLSTKNRTHDWVTHGADEWVRGETHTNSVESA